MSDLRVTIENGTTSVFRTAPAAIRALLRELENEELNRLALYWIRAESMRRTEGVVMTPPELVGTKAVPEKPYVTEL